MRSSATVFIFVLLWTASLHGQWLPQALPSGPTMMLSVDFADSSVGVASGYMWGTNFFGRAIHTTNAGADWQLSAVPDSARSLVSVQFIDRNTAFIAGAYNVRPTTSSATNPNLFVRRTRPRALGWARYFQSIGLTDTIQYRGMFLKTTDSGRSWFAPGVLPDSIYYLIGMSFANPRIGYVTADANTQFGTAAILKTTNGGATWSRQSIPESVIELRHIYAIDSLRVVAAGYAAEAGSIFGTLLLTTNGGASWQQLGFAGIDNFTDVFFQDGVVGYAVGIDNSIRGAVFKSNDAGNSWTRLPFAPDSVLLSGVRFARNANVGFVFGNVVSAGFLPPFIARSTDAGTSWSVQNIPGSYPDHILNGGCVVSTASAYVSGGTAFSEALVLHTTNGGLTFRDENADVLPLDCSLNQNYPNPFNPTTNIRFTIQSSQFTSLKVFDLLSREVATLVNEVKSPGTYTVRWDARLRSRNSLPAGRHGGGQASGFASGVYLYRLQAGSFVAVKRMVLIR
ncbi:MAG: T9SS type A sorting domain-containing protein [Ignavibacteriae bacterium]|nr:T9SS type A sorting domain-containing protein [Ignavibacteriota bacterium]